MLVPVPCKKPDGPYSIIHDVSDPPAIQETSKEFNVVELEEGQFPEPTVVVLAFPEFIIFPRPSVTSHVISPG